MDRTKVIAKDLKLHKFYLSIHQYNNIVRLVKLERKYDSIMENGYIGSDERKYYTHRFNNDIFPMCSNPFYSLYHLTEEDYDIYWPEIIKFNDK